jgi:quercetin 2,3-dioxygenase
MKQIKSVSPAPQPHWVGDGFRVHAMFTHESHGKALSPFLMLDYGAPHAFTPTTKPRGVGTHPHRGFETVTIAYAGEVSHLDSTGNGGTIGPGDVQWMTAGSGIVHQEFHSEAFTRDGGIMHMAQLWVNLPKRAKMMAPGYQGINSQQIPTVNVADGLGQLRVIAGEFSGSKGPAQTQTPMWVFDLKLQAGATLTLPFPEGWSAAVVVMEGKLTINDSEAAGKAQLVVFSQSGADGTLTAESDCSVLVLAGEPILEPIVGYGPFVMNTREEIIEAVNDFNSGKFGTVPQ